MTHRIELKLTAKQRTELEHIRDRHDKPYMRERAMALLKVAAGQAVRQVVAHGLLKARDPETVAAWVRRYQTDELTGLVIWAGLGRKPALSPSHASVEAARTKLEAVVHSPPREHGPNRSHWWLGGLAHLRPLDQLH